MSSTATDGLSGQSRKMDHPAAMQAKIVPQIMQPDENRYWQAADGVGDQIASSIATHLLAVMSPPPILVT